MGKAFGFGIGHGDWSLGIPFEDFLGANKVEEKKRNYCYKVAAKLSSDPTLVSTDNQFRPLFVLLSF